MSRAPRGSIVCYDDGAYSKQRGRAVYARRPAEALAEVYANRGRLLGHQQYWGTRARAIPHWFPDTSQAAVGMGKFYGEMSVTGRRLGLLVVCRVSTLEPRYVMPTLVAKVVESRHDGSTDSATTTLSTLALQPMDSMGAGLTPSAIAEVSRPNARTLMLGHAALPSTPRLNQFAYYYDEWTPAVTTEAILLQVDVRRTRLQVENAEVILGETAIFEVDKVAA